MKMRFLGKTGIQVSELCLGTGNFGATGVYERSGRIEEKEADLLVNMALDRGINFFNTAERYSYGIAEEVFGKALGSKRQEAIVTTKINPARTRGPNDGELRENILLKDAMPVSSDSGRTTSTFMKFMNSISTRHWK